MSDVKNQTKSDGSFDDPSTSASGPTVEDQFFIDDNVSSPANNFHRFEETERVVRAPAGPPVNASMHVDEGIDVDMDETRPFAPAAGPPDARRGALPMTGGGLSSMVVDPSAYAPEFSLTSGPSEPTQANMIAAPDGSPILELTGAVSVAPSGAPLSAPSGPAVPRAKAFPVVAAATGVREPPPPEEAQIWRARIESLVKEAKARAGETQAAPLWFEAGRIFEGELLSLRDAAQHYQEAHKADPGFLPVVHAARRLFAQLGKWQMVVILIDEEKKLDGAPVAPLLVEKGRIHETKLAKVDDAIALYRDALRVDPAYAPAVDALARHLVVRQDHEELTSVLASAAATTQDRRQKHEWLLERARIEETQLDDEVRARATYEAAYQLVPEDRGALDAIRRLAARAGDEERLVAALSSLSNLTADGEVIPFLLEEARLRLKKDDVDGAVLALRRARANAPADTVVLAELSRLLERQQQWAELVDVLVSLVQYTHDASERVALHADAGRIAERELKDVDQAIAHYRACIMIDAGYQPAISSLGRLFARTMRFSDLVDVYDIQIRAAVDDSARTPLLFKLAELLADKLDDSDSAIEKLKEILTISPGYLPALKLVSSLYVRQARWVELLEMYEAELLEQQDRDQAIFLLEKIGSISENQRDDIDGAISAYQRMFTWSPGYLPALRALGRLYAKTERWPDLIAINDEESQIVGDQNQVVSLLHRNGEIYSEKLSDLDRAIECFQKALTLLPNYLPALKALGIIYARAGRFEDLIAMHRQEAEVVRTPEQRSHLLFQIAQIANDKLGDRARAAKAYMELLDDRPGYYPAIRELARIAESANDPAILVDVYEKEVAVLTDPRDRAVMRCRAAEVLDRQLDRLDDAVLSVEKAVEEAPGLLLAHQRLISYLARKNDAKLEAKARERMGEMLPDEGSLIANLRSLIEIYLYGLDDAEKARNAAERLLALKRDDRDALRKAIGCCVRLKDYRLAITHAEALADVDPNPDEVATLHLQVASWKEGHLDPPQDALRNYVRVLEFDPHNPVALRAVEQAYVVRGAWEGLSLLYEREREGTTDPVRIADLSMKLGDLNERRLDDSDRACREYEAVLRAMPSHIPAISRLKELYGQSGSPDQKLRMLALEAQASRDPQSAITTLLEVGALQRDQFQNVDAAVDAFYQVLVRDPLHADAYAALEELLVDNQRPQVMIDAMRARANAVSSVDERVSLLMRIAQLLVDPLQRVDEANRVYLELLQLDEKNAMALAYRGDLRFRQGAFDDAVDCFKALLRVTDDHALMAPAHHRLGIVFGEHKIDVASAVHHLDAAVAMDEGNRDAARRLAVAYAQANEPQKAVEVRKKLVATAATNEEALFERLALAALYETALSDFGQAASSLVHALEITTDAGNQRDLYARIAQLYAKAGDLVGYVAFAERQAAALVEKDPRQAAEVLAKGARIAADEIRNPDLAVRLAKKALDVSPEFVEVRALLADQLTTMPGQALTAVEEHRRILRSGRIRRESVRALFRAWHGQRAYDKAFCAAEVMCFLRGASEDEELYFGENRQKVKKDSDETLPMGELTSWVVHPDQRNVLHEILALAVVDLGKLDPDDLSVYEVEKKDILTRRSDDPLRRTLIDPIARALDAPAFDVWRTRKKAAIVEAHSANPLVLVVGGEIAKQHPAREQRFLVGRKVMALRCGHPLVAGMNAEKAKTLFSAIGKAVEKSFIPLVDRPDLDLLTKRVSGALSRGTKRALVEPVGQLQALGNKLDFDAFLNAMTLTEARGGLVASCDLTAAMVLVARDRGVRFSPDGDVSETVARDAVMTDLIAFATSDEYFQTRQTLRYAIDS